MISKRKKVTVTSESVFWLFQNLYATMKDELNLIRGVYFHCYSTILTKTIIRALPLIVR
jgi:hypothetical protein